MNLITGINDTHNFAISYSDSRCPCCGHRLQLIKSKIIDNEIYIKYICNNCNLFLPIKHIGKNYNNIIPCTDNAISNFLLYFGSNN